MDHVLIDTSAGKIGLAGRLHAAPPRPSLLMVSGAFPEKGKHHELVGWFPEANVLIANLPGMGGVPWSDADASQLTAGLAETIQLMFREQPLVVCGCSASSLVTIPLTSANIHRKIILEPFLTTQGLWPFCELLALPPQAESRQQAPAQLPVVHVRLQRNRGREPGLSSCGGLERHTH